MRAQRAVAHIGLALGFFAIAPLTGLVARGRSHYRALIPGGFLLLLGANLLLGALSLVTFLSMYLWLAFIVVVGLVLIWRGLQPRREHSGLAVATRLLVRDISSGRRYTDAGRWRRSRAHRDALLRHPHSSPHAPDACDRTVRRREPAVMRT